MAEYIEREALLKAARRDKAIGLCQADIVDVQDLINSQPAAYVVKVVHGEWEFVEDKYCSTARCSCCGQRQGLYINGHKPEWNYCPNCGAKMDGGKENV